MAENQHLPEPVEPEVVDAEVVDEAETVTETLGSGMTVVNHFNSGAPEKVVYAKNITNLTLD